MTKTMIAAVLAMSLAASANATIRWVDAENGNDGSQQGTSESSAFKTIQAAITRAANGDEIRVKPGVYNTGSTMWQGTTCRVSIGKKLKIVSTGGKDVTHISGGGTMRCVAFAAAGTGSVVEGFTLRDGHMVDSSSADTIGGSGSAAAGYNNGWLVSQGYLVDCVISNCVAKRGTLRGCTAVRCWITDNSTSVGGNCCRKADLINCLITRNKGTVSLVTDGCKMVNCTAVDNYGLVDTITAIYNSVVMSNTRDSKDGNIIRTAIVSNCVTRLGDYASNFTGDQTVNIVNASHFQLIAPLFDDYRVLKGSATETAGDASMLATAITLPDGIDPYKDFFGNTIPNSGTIAAGCIQTVVEPQGGAILVSGQNNVLTRGKVNIGMNLCAYAETWPTQFMVQAKNKGNPAIYCFWVGDVRVYPTMDDSLFVAPPSDNASSYTITTEAASATYYVNPDPTIGSDSTTTGTNPETPYLTLQAAVNGAGTSYARVVRAAPGDYNKGGKYLIGLTNRVVLSGYGMRIIGSGADKSTIWGAPDPSTGGNGTNATRCVASNYAPRSCVQGFTLRDGYGAAYSSTDSGAQYGAGAVYNSKNYDVGSLHVIDCIVTNCHSGRGGAGYGVAFERTRITDCNSSKDWSVTLYSTLLSCVVDHCGSTGYSANQYGRAYYTSFIGSGTDKYVIRSDTGTTLNSCLVMNTKELTGPASAVGTFAWNVPTFSASAITYSNPLLADVGGGDYRPLIIDDRVEHATIRSPLLGGGQWHDITSSGFNMASYEGKALNLINGRPTAGAMQYPTFKVIKPGALLIFW